MRLFLDSHRSRALGMAFVLLETCTLTSAQVSRQGHRSFADSLTEELYANDNECSSSWGVSMMFDLVNPGGTNTTKMELCDVVSLCSNSSQEELLWSDTVAKLVKEYDGRCVNNFTNFQGESECAASAPTLEIANSVWVDIERSLKPSYNATVGDLVQQTNFSDNAAGATVNAWVNASTRGLIDSIVDDGPLFPPHVLMALNSIYLKAQWAKLFAETYTNQDKFYDSPTRDTALDEEANFMHMVDYFPYSHDAIPGYQLLLLPYASGTLSMVLALPMDAGAAPLSSTDVIGAVPSLTEQRMAIALPKFKFQSAYGNNLETALQTIGLSAPFDDQEGFCDLFDDTIACQYIDLIVQKTVIEVNEFGTIAAAVTLGGLAETSLPIDIPTEFMADHAFQFFIYDMDEDLVLFEGRVGAPTVVNESPAMLQSNHTDADFWMSNFWVEPTIPASTASSTSSTPSPSSTTTTGSTPSPSSTTTTGSTTPSPSSTTTTGSTPSQSSTTTGSLTTPPPSALDSTSAATYSNGVVMRLCISVLTIAVWLVL